MPNSDLDRAADAVWMGRALRLARRAYGWTSPNPLVGAVLVRDGNLLGEGWHRRAGEPHAEIKALRKTEALGLAVAGATLYVTLEPCSTFGRTPPCTDAIVAAGISRVVAAATDPNPKHAGRGFDRLRAAGLEVVQGVRAEEAARLNEAFNHWIVHGTPWVTLKAAMSLDGKIATASGESRWITGERARQMGMTLRQGADAILVGVNTILTDDPALTARRAGNWSGKRLRRIVLDGRARVPLSARVISDAQADLTTVVVTRDAPEARLARLRKRVQVWVAPRGKEGIELEWVLRRLGQESVTSLLVEGGGAVNASFLFGGFVHRVAFFYAPIVLGGVDAPGGVGGAGVRRLADALQLSELAWRRAGPDWLLTARVSGRR